MDSKIGFQGVLRIYVDHLDSESSIPKDPQFEVISIFDSKDGKLLSVIISRISSQMTQNGPGSQITPHQKIKF